MPPSETPAIVFPFQFRLGRYVFHGEGWPRATETMAFGCWDARRCLAGQLQDFMTASNEARCGPIPGLSLHLGGI